jgi:hypothetical protein
MIASTLEKLKSLPCSSLFFTLAGGGPNSSFSDTAAVVDAAAVDVVVVVATNTVGMPSKATLAAASPRLRISWILVNLSSDKGKSSPLSSNFKTEACRLKETINKLYSDFFLYPTEIALYVIIKINPTHTDNRLPLILASNQVAS